MKINTHKLSVLFERLRIRHHIDIRTNVAFSQQNPTISIPTAHLDNDVSEFSSSSYYIPEIVLISSNMFICLPVFFFFVHSLYL